MFKVGFFAATREKFSPHDLQIMSLTYLNATPLLETVCNQTQSGDKGLSTCYSAAGDALWLLAGKVTYGSVNAVYHRVYDQPHLRNKSL